MNDEHFLALVLVGGLGSGCSTDPAEMSRPEAANSRVLNTPEGSGVSDSLQALERMDPYDDAMRGNVPHSYKIQSHGCASGRTAMRLLLRTELAEQILQYPERFRRAIVARASCPGAPHRQAYLHFLGEWGDEESYRHLRQISTEDLDPSLKDFALILLCSRGSWSDRESLTALVGEETRSPLARAWARHALEGGAASSQSILRETSRMLATSDDEPGARWVRVLLLAQTARLRDREAVYALAKILTHDDTFVRHAAFLLLNSLILDCPVLVDGHDYIDAPKATEVLQRRMFEWFGEVGLRLLWDEPARVFRPQERK